MKASKIPPEKATEAFQHAIRDHQAGKLSHAAKHYQEAIVYDPENPVYYNNLGSLFSDLQQTKEAIATLNRAIELNPSFVQAYNNLGLAYKQNYQVDEAIEAFEKSIALNGEHINPYFNLANLFREKGLLTEASINYQRVLQLDKQHVGALNALALIYKQQNKFSDALACFGIALEHDPENLIILNNLGLSYLQHHQIDQALVYYERALASDPTSAEAHWNYARTKLLMGDLSGGFKDFHWRWHCPALQLKPRDYAYPFWQGEPLDNKTLLIWNEQGIGDEIQFASFIPKVMQLAKSCVLECDERLKPLYQRSFPELTIFSESEARNELPKLSIDYQTALGELPSTIPGTFEKNHTLPPYLTADLKHSETLRQRYVKATGKSFIVGIAWHTERKDEEGIQRNTKLNQWKGIVSNTNCGFVNLQYGMYGQEINKLNQKLGLSVVHDDSIDPLNDLDSFAAQIQAMDLIISIDNSTVHLAGALGKPVWALIPFACDWRWQYNRSESYWYPNVHLHRQAKMHEWDPVLNDLAEQLQDRSTQEKF